MKNSVLSLEEKKARKRAADKAYRERKKLGIVGRPKEDDAIAVAPAKTPKATKAPKASTKKEKEEKIVKAFTETFGFPVRLYWNQRIETTASSCAKAGTELTFEEMKNDGNQILYRVRRGKRNFFTTSKELVAPQK